MGGFKFDWFMKGMLIAVGLAALWPEPGAHGGWLHPELLNKLGVALIFFLSGLSLSFAALRAGTLQWRVHLLVQTTTFLVFPLLGLLILWATRGWMKPDLQLGFFYLCALPSTVSSSVALTAAARGNVPAALFNATLSSLLGVVLTPAWLGFVLGQTGAAFPIWDVMLDLLQWLVLPLVLGQLSRPLLGNWAAKHKKRLSTVDRLTILLLVYTSFADSVAQGVWSHYGVGALVETVVGTALIFAVVLLAVNAVARALGMAEPERVASVFCGSKKTLASGVPMAQLIFGANPALGLILLPIMIYHPLQLAVGGVLAQRWARAAE
ncbi:bile acid:sodium symporter family protein [Derxia lacustris]|uniref:bile acid:sodium symporter family protein n=1 Tax=Derxia lacustris TaxID=764842 RepID=UPI000A16CFE1|nr:bile acid:sodium symporter family protein [Derxia lacustris]